ncbi:hypothetical protein BCR42DRAFT_402400 [Absidia repens]|uniref:Uncharacterized protein n=1 Tax=Absidia repens TaxID=90262 RepID=A0A1X2IZP7_9FUNG|nr:hypothetical protein BCR42DRAFT_402400 [Absidia repens]
MVGYPIVLVIGIGIADLGKIYFIMNSMEATLFCCSPFFYIYKMKMKMKKLFSSRECVIVSREYIS